MRQHHHVPGTAGAGQDGEVLATAAGLDRCGGPAEPAGDRATGSRPHRRQVPGRGRSRPPRRSAGRRRQLGASRVARDDDQVGAETAISATAAAAPVGSRQTTRSPGCRPEAFSSAAPTSAAASRSAQDRGGPSPRNGGGGREIPGSATHDVRDVVSHPIRTPPAPVRRRRHDTAFLQTLICAGDSAPDRRPAPTSEPPGAGRSRSLPWVGARERTLGRHQGGGQEKDRPRRRPGGHRRCRVGRRRHRRGTSAHTNRVTI